MLAKIIQFVNQHLDDIILVIGVILISLLSFAMGYIVAKEQEKEPLKMEKLQAPSTKLQTNSKLQLTDSRQREFYSLFHLS